MGNAQAETTLDLLPHGHIARFLYEFFPSVANINEFEGSVVVSSDQGERFAGLTLRLTGDSFTSLPIILPADPNSTKTEMAFPQIADGLLNQIRYSTSVIMDSCRISCWNCPKISPAAARRHAFAFV